MYAGHAALALALKAREPRVPVILLVVASYGPDWVELWLGLFIGRGIAERYSHFIPAVVAGGLVAGALYALLTLRRGAGFVLLAWLLHWPADFLTAYKPLLHPSHVVGLDLYHLPPADFVLEALLVAGCCVFYARTYASTTTGRRWVLAVALVLIGMQAALDYGIWNQAGRVWRPTLVERPWRSHPACAVSAGPVGTAPHASCNLAGVSHSERTMAKDGPRGVVTLVCLTCGKEKFFTQDVPAAVTCEQCGSTVFRTFMTPTEPDEAAIDAAEAQARSMAYGDSSPDTTADDVRDLDVR